MLNLKRIIQTSVAVAALLITAAVTRAELIYGYGSDNGGPVSLFTFDSAAPGSTSALTEITGIATGLGLVGIDFRSPFMGSPNGQLYGLAYDGTNMGQLYIISLTGVATPVGSPISIGAADQAGNVSFGFDFNPTVDRIRVVTGNLSNFRINPNDGTIVTFDPDVAYVAGDPNENSNIPQIGGSGYLPDGTLFNIDGANNVLARQGSPNANDGTLTTIGTGLGITTLGPNTMGFDINPDGSVAYLQTSAGSGTQDNLYTVDLTDGTATLVGAIGPSTLNTFGIAVIPEPSTYALLAIGLVGGAILLRRRKAARV